LKSTLLSGFSNPNYYGGSHKFAPDSASWEKANAFLAANPTQFTMSTTQAETRKTSTWSSALLPATS
jgi:hypothetical protein